MISNKKNKYSIRGLFLLKYLVLMLVIFILSFSNTAAIAKNKLSTEKTPEETQRYRVFSLKHISVEQAQQYLNTARVNVKTEKLRDTMLSIAGWKNGLIKASEIIKLVDSKDKFIIKNISLPQKQVDLPSNEEIAAQIPKILIGDFSNPPRGIGPKAIINLQENNLLVAAPIDKYNQIEKIITEAFPKIQKTKTDPNIPPDSNEPQKIEQKKLTDANDLILPDTNDLEKIDANHLPKTDVNDSNLVDVLDRLVTSLGKPRVPEPRKTEITVPAEVTEPNKPPVEKKKEKVEKPQKEQEQTEQLLTRIQTETKDQNEPQPSDTNQPAQIRSYRPELIVDGNEVLTVELPEKLKIVDLLALAGEYLHLNYMYDPAQVQGEVTLKIGGELIGRITVGELYPLVESVLKFKGLVMTRRGNFMIIVPKEQAKDIDPVLIDSTKGKIETGDVLVTGIFELKYIDAESAKNLLASMNLGVDINTSASQAGVIIVTGYAYRMPRIEQLLNLVDIPGEEKEFRFRQLKFTMATNLKDKIKTLADQLGTVSITVAATVAAPTPTSPRRQGESEAAYRARLAREARTRRPTPTTTPSAPTAEPTVYLDVDDRTNRILMIGLPQQLDVVEHLIDTLDVEQQDMRSLKVYEIQNVDAQEVTTKLQQLGIISTSPTAGRARTTSTTQRVTTPTGRTPPGTPAGGRITPTTGAPSEQEPLVEEPQVVIIESTNSLLVNATAEQHAQIATIIGFVDAEPEEASINYVVYPLENQEPEELAGILNQLILETVEQRDPSGKLVRTETTRKTEEDITIIADENTFSLIVYASKKNQQWIESLIRQLDKRRPQVLIDVTLVEITKNDDFTLDLDLLTKYPTIPIVGDLGNIGQIIADPNLRIWEARAKTGTGITAFYADEHIQSLLTAMNKKGYGRVLARPKLLVNDNEVGTIRTEEKQTIVRPETTVLPGISGSTPTASTSIKFEQNIAGITLDVEPHISEGDLLRLKITMTRIDFRRKDDYSLLSEGKAFTGPTPPDLLTSDVTTIITVPDKKTIILGGLERLNQLKGGTKTPILGDIPFVGGLFRNISNVDAQSRLYVFVKANILRPSEQITGESDIIRVSKQNREKFEKYEREMQEYEDWPGIKPKPMDPLKILEDD